MSLTSQVARGMLLGALVMGPAAAQTGGDAGAEDPVEALADRGLKCFQARDFECAVKAYREAYQFEPLAPLLYNIAFIYDKKLDEPALALDYYRRFVNAPDAPTETKLAAYERIVELQPIVDKIEQDKRKGAPGPGPGPGQGDPQPPPPPPPDDTQATVGWITVGVGGALLATGGIFALLADQDATTQDSTTDPVEWNDLRDSGPTKALVADIGMAVGGAAVIAGLIVVLTADDSPAPAEAEPKVTVGPSASGVGLSIGGAF